MRLEEIFLAQRHTAQFYPERDGVKFLIERIYFDPKSGPRYQ